MHVIRLRGPWEFSFPGTNVSGRITFPCTWPDLAWAVASSGSSPVLSRCAGERPAITLTLLRRFAMPTGLEPGDRVLVTLRHSAGDIVARLNGAVLSLTAQPDGTHQADITLQLAERNELAIDLAPPSPAPLDSQRTVLESALQIYPAS